MINNLRSLYRIAILATVLFFSALSQTKATHIYGADFFYTYAGGNSYNVTLVVYGDCSGSAFPNLSSAAPQVFVYNGSTQTATITLAIQAPSAGTEVTPVCASQLNNTNCVNITNPIPGVKKFTYTGVATISTASANWRFLFTGNMGVSAQAGRSNSITNINVGGGGSVMQLEATLNNTGGNNSSPVYTTIPTPFFCINKAANYNPGTVDPNGDSLAYSLVPGLDQASGTVTYLTGYTATAPLAVSTGSFSFSGTTGQLGFTPNAVQRSLVVNKVTEYRGGVAVGTSMREMTFVVLNNCNNNPPRGSITNASGGTIVDTVTFKACQSSGTISFSINPIDPDNDTINMSASGIPAGAIFTINNNNTQAPSSSFNWNISGVTPGTYNFFITYTDAGCPLSSRQTQAYSITVLPNPSVTFALVSPATCVKKARFNLTPNGIPSPWTINVIQGATTLHSFIGITGTQLDSLSPGTYTIRTTNANGCYKDTSITIAAPPTITASVTMVQPTCYGNNNGSITITGGGGAPPFTYAIGAGAYSSTNTFTGLTAGTYTLHIKDTNLCVKDTTVTLSQPAAITLAIASVKPPCNFFSNGSITVTASNGISPYQYAIGSGSYSSTNTFINLSAGTYVLHAKDANNCTKDSTFLLQDSIKVHATATVTNILCHGDTTGAITLNAFGGTVPYKYQKGTGSLGYNNSFTNLPAGTYNFHIEDTDRCYLDTAVVITEPGAITTTSVVTNILCYGNATGSIVITAMGGTGTFTYAMGAGPYSSTNAFSGLTAGTYTLHAKDANGCIKDTTITITQPTQLIIMSLTKVDANCNNSSDGSATIIASGGTTPYTYAIGTGSFGSSNIFSGLSAGAYALHLKDANGCQVDTSVTINQPTAIVPTVSLKNSTCSPLNNGQVIVSATGGVPSYTYAVGTGSYSASGTFSSLAAGTYIFHVKDSHSCIKDTLINVVDSLTVTASIIVTNTLCYQDNNGSIAVSGGGGVSPYTYAIGSGSYVGSGTFGGLGAGNYTIHVKDNIGCTKDTTPVTVTEPTKVLPVVLAITQPSCYGYTNGSIFITGTGGTPPYTYALGSGAYSTSSIFNGLAIGTYTLHVKDANNCVHDTTVTVTQPAPLGLTTTITDVNCYGEKSGAVTVNGTGGTPAYSYSADFNPFQPSSTLGTLAAGPHYIRLQDANGCLKDTTVLLSQPARFYIDKINIIGATCEGFTDGAIEVLAKGGTPTYLYATDNNAFGSINILTGLGEGTYLVHLKDSHGCTIDSSVTVTGYPHISIDGADITDVTCFDLSDGKITIEVTGGVQPLTYKLDNSNFNPDNTFTGLKAGNYKITVSDSKGCLKDTTVSINQPELLKVKAVATPNDCEGYDNMGTVTAVVEGGTQPYNYKWSAGDAYVSEKVSGLPNGKYWVWVKDENNCTDSSKTDVLYDNCCKVFVPDAFTPNGDGRNDKARILFKGDFTLKIFSIYNRFGQRVFTTTNINDGWDGFFNGALQDLDTYNYYIKGICGNGGTNDVEYKGTITLIH